VGTLRTWAAGRMRQILGESQNEPGRMARSHLRFLGEVEPEDAMPSAGDRQSK